MAKMRKITKASKRRLMMFGTISVVVICYFFALLVGYVFNIDGLSKEQQQLQSNLSNLKQQEQELSTEIEKLKDPDYLARYARENYAYSKDGEYIIQLQEKDPIDELEEQVIVKEYIIGLGSVILFFILIYIIRRGRKKKKTKK